MEAGDPILLPHVEGPCLLAVEATGVVLSGKESGMDPGFSVARTTDGRFFTSARWEQGTVLAFHPDGSFLDRIGAFGEGPGEFGNVGALIPSAGGGLHVFHGGRWSRIEETLEVTPLGRHPALVHATAVNTAIVNDSVVVVMDPMAPGIPSTGRILRLEGGQVEEAASFETGTGLEVEWMAILPPVAWPGTGETFWTGPWISSPDVYRIEERDLGGGLVRTVERRHPWTLPGPDPRAMQQTTVSLAPLSASVVLVGVVIPGSGVGASGPSRPYEVLDLESGAILSSGSRFLDGSGPQVAFVGAVPEAPFGSLGYVTRTLGGGIPEVHLSEISLSAGPAGSTERCS